MTCDECQTTDHTTLYRHAITNKRYCYRCWRKIRPDGPVPIDRCSDAVKNAAAMAGGVVWKPKDSTMTERSIITQIIDGVPVKYCTICKLLMANCKCDKSKAIIAAELKRSNSEAQTALVVVPNATPLRQHPALHKCALCDTISNDGAWLDSNIYWCGTCLADIEESGRMISKHIKLKLRGSPTAIAFFHYVCTQIDNDWPWSDKKPSATPCPKCGGLLYVSAVLEAEEIRTIAQQAGVGKCKIPYFADVRNCFER